MGSHANYSIYEDGPESLILEDLGPWDQHMTVTNDAEHVLAEVAPILKGRRLVYLDSSHDLTEILVKEGRFDGFRVYHGAADAMK